VNGKGKLLPTVRDIVGYLEAEMSVTLKKLREQQGGAVVENRDYTINHRSFVCWDKDNPMPRQSGAKEADPVPGNDSGAVTVGLLHCLPGHIYNILLYAHANRYA
jgi:hypothetical protein